MPYYVVTVSGKKVHVIGNHDTRTVCGLKPKRHADNKDLNLPTCTSCRRILHKAEI